MPRVPCVCRRVLDSGRLCTAPPLLTVHGPSVFHLALCSRAGPQKDLKEIFAPFGPIEYVQMNTDESSGSGFAFVQYQNGEAAKYAPVAARAGRLWPYARDAHRRGSELGACKWWPLGAGWP